MLYTKEAIGTIGYLGGLPAVLEEFSWSFANMVAYCYEYLCHEGTRIHLARSPFSFHSYARNNLVDQMQGDWLLMLDTDHQFEPDLAVRMVNVMYQTDAMVVSGLYHHKTPPYPPVVYAWAEDGEHFSPIVDWESNVFEIASSGGGCLLVRREVFEQIREELHEEPFAIEGSFGEDHSFFRRLRRVGITPVCAAHIEAYHLMIQPMRHENYTVPENIILKEHVVEGYS